MIAPDYDPVRTANTILIRKMALLLKEKEPLTVVTMTPEGDSAKKGAVQEKDGIRIVRLPEHSLRGGIRNPEDSRADRIRMYWLKGKEMLLENAVSERQALHFTKDLEKRIDLREIRAMISFCAPFTAHLCAAALHRRYPVPWLAYYFDPFFSNETLDPGRAGLRKHLEERTLAEASLVMMTYPTDEDYRSRGIGFGEKIRRAEMPGVVFGESGSPREKRAGDKRICSFFGTLYRDIRNPDPVIRVFSRIGEGMTLRFVGSHEGIHPEDYRAAYPEVEFLGKQSGERLRELYREADVLLNIGNTVLNQMPSKIFEYISTGKPILNVFQSPRCPTLRYLKDYPLALNLAEEELRNRPEESAEKIRRFCLETAGKTAEEAFLRKRYGANTFESAVEEIGKQLRRIMEPDRK